MALNQFGAIMTFAIEMEGQLAKFYQKAAAELSAQAGELKGRADGSHKRRKRIERSRRSDVTEITLEPIEGLNVADYELNRNDTSATAVDEVERIVQKFYTEAAPKINVRESRRVLERCLKEHAAYSPLS